MQTELALMGYLVWMLLLVVALEIWRGYLVATKAAPITAFEPGGTGAPERMARLNAAYGNCAENFPVVGGLLLFAIFKQWQALTDPLALSFLAARLVQSLAHVASGGVLATQLRATAYGVQLAIAGYWCWLIFARLLAGG